nr:hypothetical protein Iba_chr05cCG18150 [Ipomoea batatas]
MRTGDSATFGNNRRRQQLFRLSLLNALAPNTILQTAMTWLAIMLVMMEGGECIVSSEILILLEHHMIVICKARKFPLMVGVNLQDL